MRVKQETCWSTCINDDQAAAWLQNAANFADRPANPCPVMSAVSRADPVKGSVLEGKLFCRSLPGADITNVPALGLVADYLNHFGRQVIGHHRLHLWRDRKAKVSCSASEVQYFRLRRCFELVGDGQEVGSLTVHRA